MNQIFPQLHTQDAMPRGRDGCDCPPWVIRCAHFGGEGIVITTPHQTAHDFHCTNVPFTVYLMSNWVKCERCGDMCHPAGGPSFYIGANYDAALTAFLEAEEALLRSPDAAP